MKYRSDLKLNGSEMPADISVTQPNKRLATVVPEVFFHREERRERESSLGALLITASWLFS